ncbi:MAG: ferritin-like domain-containing protein [Longimicrobiales bacterium]
MTDSILEVLEEARVLEKEQTLFYRALAAAAGSRGQEELSERLNALHADEQHHFSRLTARVLELGGTPREANASLPGIPTEDEWEAVARSRERREISWYLDALKGPMDPGTEALLREILESEEHHSRELGGKWMSA